jgi:hypothetical protein
MKGLVVANLEERNKLSGETQSKATDLCAGFACLRIQDDETIKRAYLSKDATLS